jgi:cation transport ATPase
MLAQAMLDWLRAQASIKLARINYDCASLVIEYDTADEPLLRALLGRLRLMTVDELLALLGSTQRADSAPATAFTHRQRVPRFVGGAAPLALPSISLLMALSTNPLVAAANMPLMLWNGFPIALRAWRVWRRERRLNVDFLDALAIAASLAQGNPLAGAIVTWLIKLGDSKLASASHSASSSPTIL